MGMNYVLQTANEIVRVGRSQKDLAKKVSILHSKRLAFDLDLDGRINKVPGLVSLFKGGRRQWLSDGLQCHSWTLRFGAATVKWISEKERWKKGKGTLQNFLLRRRSQI